MPFLIMQNAQADAGFAPVLDVIPDAIVGNKRVFGNGSKVTITGIPIPHFLQGSGLLGSQLWDGSGLINPASWINGAYPLTSNPNDFLVLDADMNHIHENGCPVQLWHYTGAPNQQWSSFWHTNAAGQSNLVIQLPFNNKVLTADGQNTWPSGHPKIFLSDFTANPNQLWWIKSLH